MNQTVHHIREMLAAGEINESDRRHADELVNRTPESELAKSNLNWLDSLEKRGGAPFVKS